jgi:hypothetical protein
MSIAEAVVMPAQVVDSISTKPLEPALAGIVSVDSIGTKPLEPALPSDVSVVC